MTEIRNHNVERNYDGDSKYVCTNCEFAADDHDRFREVSCSGGDD